MVTRFLVFLLIGGERIQLGFLPQVHSMLTQRSTVDGKWRGPLGWVQREDMVC